jgi:hypothetical protein
MITLAFAFDSNSINASIANSSVIPSIYEGGGLRQAHAVSEKPVRVRAIRPECPAKEMAHLRPLQCGMANCKSSRMSIEMNNNPMKAV